MAKPLTGPGRGNSRGFTLIEMMVAVLIISVVIGSLIQLFSNNPRLLGRIEQNSGFAMYGTLFVGVSDPGFVKEEVTLDKLVADFELDDALRRELKQQKAFVDYRMISRLDEGDLADNVEEIQAGTVRPPLKSAGLPCASRREPARSRG